MLRLFETIWAAKTSTRCSRACWSGQGSTRSLTNPWARASLADKGMPVNSILALSFGLKLRASGTPGVLQKTPNLTPGVEKAACWEATTRSQLAASWHPAAAASPYTSAIVGTLSSLRLKQSRVNSENTCSWSWRPASAVNSFKLWPFHPNHEKKFLNRTRLKRFIEKSRTNRPRKH